jgi:hypothetical protein
MTVFGIAPAVQLFVGLSANSLELLENKKDVPQGANCVSQVM